MISSNKVSLKFLLSITFAISILSACGGGGGGGGSNGGSFTNEQANTKPQNSSVADTSQASSSKSAQAKSSSSLSSIVKVASSVKGTTSGAGSSAPATPTNFMVVSAFSDVIFLSWSKTTDTSVVAYKLYRDGVQIADLAEYENYYADYNVAPGRAYEYGVTAGDAAGHWSDIISISATATLPIQTSSKASSSVSSIKVSSASSSAVTIPNSSSSSTTNTSSKSSSLSAGTSSSKASSSSVSSSSNISSSSSMTSSSSSSVKVGVSFQWQRPTLRENGNDMFEHEIARYELRYKLPGTTAEINVIVASPLLSRTLIDAPSNAIFEIATVDTNGLYSQFVPIEPL